jgi:cytochrome c oxidase cbb3-type subunit 2
MSLWQKHAIFETNSIVLLIGILIVIAIGGLVEIAPLFYLKNTIEAVEGVRPYTPLELAGRNIYVREGCYNCHSQMVRPLRDEVERYGTTRSPPKACMTGRSSGPNVPSRSCGVGGKYRTTGTATIPTARPRRPGSITPGYPWLVRPSSTINTSPTLEGAGGLAAYSAGMIEHAVNDVRAQASSDPSDAADLVERYKKVLARDFDGNPARISEADALIAYLQVLGTMVDFRLYNNRANIR